MKFPDPLLAHGWLKAEHANLVFAAHHAAKSWPRRSAWELADALRGYFWVGRHMVDWISTAQAGLAAAEAEHDSQGRAAMLLTLGQANHCLAQLPVAIEYLGRAVAAARDAGWTEGEATATGALGSVLSHLGDTHAALENFGEAFRLYRRLGRDGGVAVNLGNMMVLRLILGELRQACLEGEEALRCIARPAIGWPSASR